MTKPALADWDADYQALTRDCAVVPLVGWSQIQITGRDRVSFLHNICTNDVRQLAEGQCCEAFCTDVKGKIQAHVLVIAETAALQLLTVPHQSGRLIKHLDRYIIREDVQLADVTADSTWNYVVGPGVADALRASDGPLVRANLVWPGGVLTHPTKPLAEFRNVDVASLAWTAVRVESRWPLFGIDFDDSHLPQEIDRDQQAISFTKGCYLGQETIARIDALGHVNKKLVLVKFAGTDTPPAGTQLRHGENEVGAVTTASWSPQLDAPAAIAFVRRGTNDKGTDLLSEFGTAIIVSPIAAN